MRVSQAFEDYKNAILDLSPHTQRWYVEKLEVFVAWCEEQRMFLKDIRPADIRIFLEIIRKRRSPQTKKPISNYTVHGYAQVVKSFLFFCAEEYELEELVSEKLPQRIKMPRVDVKVIQTFTSKQIKRLFAACEMEYSRSLVMRDIAILAVLFDTGIRASELCGLTLENVHLIPHNAYLKVFGKGRKEREVGIGRLSRAALQCYIMFHRTASKEEKHVFLGRYTKPMTVNALDQLFYRLEEWARIRGVRCSPHTARHTFAVNYIQAGGDIYKLSILLGHTSVKVTEHYLRAYKAREARMNFLSVLDLQEEQTEDES